MALGATPAGVALGERVAPRAPRSGADPPSAWTTITPTIVMIASDMAALMM